MAFHPPERLVHAEGARLLNFFKGIVEEFKGRCVSLAERFYSRSATENEAVILVRKKRKDELLEALTPTTGTLLVVPKPLLQHWNVSAYTKVDS